MNGKVKFVLGFIAVAVVVVSGVVVYGLTWYFVLQKPSGVTVDVNSFGLELYVEQENPATIVDYIDFPNVTENGLNTTMSTPTYYLFLKEADEAFSVTYLWNATGLPAEASILAYIGRGYPLEMNTPQPKNLYPLTSGELGYEIRWELNCTNLAAGTYDFTINIYCGQ